MKKKYVLLLVIAISFLILDQWTKHLVHTKFSWGESKPVIEGFFSLTYVRNTGAAFGILHNAPAYLRDPFFIVVPVVALFVILFFFYRLPANQLLTATALSLIFSGAVGNLIDRLRFGYVIDFLDFFTKRCPSFIDYLMRDCHWPAFNVADSCIVVGVGILFVQSFQQAKLEAQAAKRSVRS